MTTYAIDDQHGNQLTAGLQESEAQRVAVAIANQRGETVRLYADVPADEDGQPTGPSWDIAPDAQ